MINPMEMTGKLVLVTGASSGLGRQICITLSQLGARIILLARNEDRLKETLELMDGADHSYYSFDLENLKEIENMIKTMVREQGKIDGFVHCSGIGDTRPLKMSHVDFMEKMMRINVLAFTEIIRVWSNKKHCNPGGSAVGVSTASTIHADKGKLGYCTSKGALDSSVRPLAIEIGESNGIRVNTVKPGWIKSGMYYEYKDLFGEEKLNEMLKKSVLGAAETYEIANVIAFLLSPAASQITGQSIVVDGGWSLW